MKKQNIYESKQGLKSMKLFNIIKQHGGFEEKTPSFYLHDMTDDDVIGVLPEDDLQKLMKMHISDRNNYAIQHGFEINRGDTMEIIPLKDWTWIGVIERNHNLPNDEYGKTRIGKLKRERGDAKRRDGAHRYQWSDTGKWGSPRAEEFYMRRTQNDIANQRRQRYGDDAVYKMNESIEGLDKFATPTDITRFTNNLIKKLYKVSQPYTSHRFRDNDWRHLKTFVEILRNVEGVEELIPAGTGPYKQSQEGAYKEYTLDITTTLGSKIGGFIRCHFCGSQENPWDVYDMTVNFYRNNEINNDNIMMNESKQGIQSKKLYDAVKEHGGFGEDWKNKMYVHGITDNDIIGIYSPEEYKKLLNGKLLNYRDLISNAGITPLDELDKIRTCSFKDGFKIIYILRRNNDIEATFKKIRRGQNAAYKSGKRPYMYSNKDRQNKVNKIKNNMSKIVLKEEELMTLVNESVKRVINEAIQNGELNENAMDWLKGKGKQIKTGFNTLTQKGDIGFGQRLKKGYDNYKAQGELNDLVSLRDMLKQGVDSGKLTPEMTVGQLIGLGKGNGARKGQKGNLTNRINSKKGVINGRGGSYNEEE